MTASKTDFCPAGFFALRTPLLPFAELNAWSEGLETASVLADDGDGEAVEGALAADRQRLRAGLVALVARPEIREGPVRCLALPNRRPRGLAPRSGRQEGTARRGRPGTLLRAHGGAGDPLRPVTVGERSRLRLAPRDDYRRHTRLDMGYLTRLTEALERDPEMRRRLRYRPNTSLYRAAGKLRYAEARFRGDFRSFNLVGVEASDYLAATLDRAREGATVAELSKVLVSGDPEGEIMVEDAEGFLDELIDSQRLVSDLAPAVTGPEPIHGLITTLEKHDGRSALHGELSATRSALGDLDGGGQGADPERHRSVARHLEALPAEVELPRLFQVDMIKPVANATLGPELIRELERGIHLMRQIGGQPRENVLAEFRRRLEERYGESRPVPLVEALDEEVGIGFGPGGRAPTPGVGSGAAPLLDGLDIPPPPSDQEVRWGKPQDALLRKLARSLADGEREIELDEADLEALANHRPLDLLLRQRHGGRRRSGGDRSRAFPDPSQGGLRPLRRPPPGALLPRRRDPARTHRRAPAPGGGERERRDLRRGRAPARGEAG